MTALVVHWNQPDECVATVHRLQAQAVSRIVVIDNASTDLNRDLLRSRIGAGTEILELSDNKGWGAALNIALANWLKTGTEPFCLISAHDAGPADDCIRLLVEAMQRDSRIGIACPQYADPTVPWFSCLHGVRERPSVPSQSGDVELVDVPHGTLMLVRRECLAQIGLFDERYFAYGDEHELGLRAGRHGWKIALVWGAVVTNRGTWTPSELRSYLFTRNSLLLVRDYCGRLSAFTRAVLILINTLRLMISRPEEGFAFEPNARWRGVRDYLSGRYGEPRRA
jgi:GT2 family glycosyltransferase